jgi:ElaB/YqjD/DUF883 family membrane-anchored ribosome-binding protein
MKILLTVFAALTISMAAPPPLYADLLTDLYGRIDKFMDLRSKFSGAKDSSWVPFRDGEKTRVRNDINDLLDETLILLLDDSLVEAKEDINRLKYKIKNLEEKVNGYDLARSQAVPSKKFYEFWKDTDTGLDDKIASLQNEIDSAQVEIAQKGQLIKKKLSDAGIALSEADITNLLITVSGADQFSSLVVLKNIYALTDRLRESMQRTKNLEVSRKYYAIFLLVTQAYERQLSLFDQKIDDTYIPRLEVIRADNLSLIEETEELARSKPQYPQYQNNLAQQRITETVAVKYRTLLESQKSIIQRRLEALRELIAYVNNTYQTVTLAASLASNMEESLTSIQMLMDLPVVPPVAFESNLEEKFQELSEKLSQGL